MDSWPVYYVLTFTAVSAGILEGPKSGNYTGGTNVTLRCIVDRNADKKYWIDAEVVKTIFDNTEKVGAGDKYDNFYLERFSYSDFSLHIINASVTDDGSYTCQAGDESQTAIITIEAPPTLKLYIKGTRYETDVHSESQSSPRSLTIICYAVGAKPSVNLRLKINDGDWIEKPNVNVTQNDLLFDSYISHDHTFIQNDISVTCQAYGQTSISFINITEILYKPACNITLIAADIVCSCDAFPPVYKYVIVMDGQEAKEESRLSIVDHPATSYSCMGTNYVGTSQSQPFSVTGYSNESKFGVVSVVVVSVVIIVVVCVVVLLILLLRRRRPKKSYKELPVTDKSNCSDITQQEQKELEQLISKVAPLIKVDWEIFAVDDLGLSETEVLGIVDNKKCVKDKVELALLKWYTNCERQPAGKSLLEIMKASKVCLDFHCNNCYEILNEARPQLSSDAQLTSDFSPNTECQQSQKSLETENVEANEKSSGDIFSVFECVGDLIGNTGAAKLAREYEITWMKQPCHKPGNKILIKLTETKELEDTNHSVELFRKNLFKCSLFGAYRTADTCIYEDLQNFIDMASHRIRFDWEIFAIDDLGLLQTSVETLCRKRKDPFKTALTTWSQEINEPCPKYKLIDIMSKSNVCKDPSNACSEIFQDVPWFRPHLDGESLDSDTMKDGHSDDVGNYGFKCFREAFSIIIGSIILEAEPVNEELLLREFKNIPTQNVTDRMKFEVISKKGEIPTEMEHSLTAATKQLDLFKADKNERTVCPTGSIDGNKAKVEEIHETEKHSIKSPDELFYEMLCKVANTIGSEGTFQLSRKYSLQKDHVYSKYKFGRPIYIVLATLISQNKLENENFLLKRFEDALNECKLFRARNLVEEFICSRHFD